LTVIAAYYHRRYGLSSSPFRIPQPLSPLPRAKSNNIIYKNNDEEISI
jgi:hypothetical protein